MSFVFSTKLWSKGQEKETVHLELAFLNRYQMSGTRTVLCVPFTAVARHVRSARSKDDSSVLARALSSASVFQWLGAATQKEIEEAAKALNADEAKSSWMLWATVGPKDFMYTPPGTILIEKIHQGGVEGIRFGCMPAAKEDVASTLAELRACNADTIAAACANAALDKAVKAYEAFEAKTTPPPPAAPA